jgi:ribonuclease HII
MTGAACMARPSGKFIAPAWPDLAFEQDLWLAGCQFIAGVDEAGRGAWAGPVTAAAVVLPVDPTGLPGKLTGVRDSKLMSAAQREIRAGVIKEAAAAYCIGWAEYSEIDELGILPATRLAMTRAILGLNCAIEHLLIDAVKLPGLTIPQTSLIKGDARSLSIAAASVLAKTSRDALMRELSKEYPGYGFERHKGYGTASHQAALSGLGVSAIHRRSYAPIRSLLDKIEKPGGD